MNFRFDSRLMHKRLKFNLPQRIHGILEKLHLGPPAATPLYQAVPSRG
jgi:hypothetical protein